MSTMNDLDYYRQRENTSRKHAAAAIDPAIAAIHAEMAERYAALIAVQIEAGAAPRPRLHLRSA